MNTYTFPGLRTKPKFASRYNMSRILETAAEVLNVDLTDKKYTSRRSDFVSVRFIAMYLKKKHCQTSSLGEIARALGYKDHTTVIYAIKRMEALMETEPNFRHLVNKIEARLFENRD